MSDQTNSQPNNNEAATRLERLKRQLYERSAQLPPVRRSRLAPLAGAEPHAWSTAAGQPPRWQRWLTLGGLKKLLWISVLFFVVTLGLTLWIFFRGGNVVSSGNVDLQVAGPINLQAGEVAALQVTVTNHNNSPLQLVDLIVEYPPGTRAADDPTTELTRVRQPLGTIQPGASAARQLRAALFGEKDSPLPIKISTEYRLADSNAIFSKETNYIVTISGAPLSLTLTAPPEAVANQEIVLQVSVIANAETALANPLVVINYPPGFRVIKAEPPATAGDNVWRLGVLKGGAKWQVRVMGTLEGQNEEEKTFRVAAGMPSADDATQVGAVYSADQQVVMINRPYVSLTAALNGDQASEYVADSRQPLKLDINWLSNLDTEITDGEVVAKLDGAALDPLSIFVGNGFYQSTANLIQWNGSRQTGLAKITPGSSGTVSASFSTLALTPDRSDNLRNPTINLNLKFQGHYVAPGQTANQLIETTLTKVIKLNSVAQLAAKVLQRSGPLTNTGPLPPKVGQETTYTVIWSVVNSVNDLNDATVSAILPPYVRWIGNTSPANEAVSFLPNASGGGKLTWELGTVKAGTGSASLPTREVVFQIGLNPSLSQVGTAPLLMDTPRLTGTDSFTNQTLSASVKRQLDTYLTASDPLFKYNDDKVVP